jgi:hypothetical protein
VALYNLETILEHGPDIEAEDRDGNTPLHFAVLAKLRNSVQRLILAGASINAQNCWKSSPLHLACMRPAGLGRMSVCHWPFPSSCPLEIDPNNEPKASTDDLPVQSEMVKLLLDHGAEVNAADGRGNSALHLLACYRSTKTMEMLLKSGAKLNSRNHNGSTPLDIVTAAISDDMNCNTDTNHSDGEIAAAFPTESANCNIDEKCLARRNTFHARQEIIEPLESNEDDLPTRFNGNEIFWRKSSFYRPAEYSFPKLPKCQETYYGGAQQSVPDQVEKAELLRSHGTLLSRDLESDSPSVSAASLGEKILSDTKAPLAKTQNTRI